MAMAETVLPQSMPTSGTGKKGVIHKQSTVSDVG